MADGTRPSHLNMHACEPKLAGALHACITATLDPGRVALVGLHSWSEDDFPNGLRWGIRSFRPDDLHLSSQPLLDWLKASGYSRVAIHFDVDVVDSNEIVFGLGAEPDGLKINSFMSKFTLNYSSYHFLMFMAKTCSEVFFRERS